MGLENIICNQADVLSWVQKRRKYQGSPKAAHLESHCLSCPENMSGMLQIMEGYGDNLFPSLVAQKEESTVLSP